MGVIAAITYVGTADVIWIITCVVPGYVPPLRGLIGPALRIAGTIFTAIGYRAAAARQQAVG